MVNKLSFFEIGKIRYLRTEKYKKGYCQICGKKRKTTAHHLVPKRLHCICPLLTEIRVRVCSECDDNFYPENKFIKASDIIKRQSKYISNLKGTIKLKNEEIRDIIKNKKEVGGK